MNDTGDATEIEQLLGAYRRGESGALDRLLPHVYEDLRRIARRQTRRRNGYSLDTTVLVHEAYLKMVEQSRVNARDRGHLLAICARAMRQFAVDEARRRQSGKRGGGRLGISLERLALADEAQAEQLVWIDQALERLAQLDPRLVQVFECRYFAGLSDGETAVALASSERTVQRDWMRARAWLRQWLEDGA